MRHLTPGPGPRRRRGAFVVGLIFLAGSLAIGLTGLASGSSSGSPSVVSESAPASSSWPAHESGTVASNGNAGVVFHPTEAVTGAGGSAQSANAAAPLTFAVPVATNDGHGEPWVAVDPKDPNILFDAHSNGVRSRR